MRSPQGQLVGKAPEGVIPGSRRTVPLIPTLVTALREQILRTPKTEHNLVFPTRRGDVYDDSTITDLGLKAVQFAAGIVKPNSISAKHPKGEAKYSAALLCVVVH